MMKYLQTRISFIVALAVGVLIGSPHLASATDDCEFVDAGTTRTLQADCTTDATILVPDGYTLDGGGHSITAVDPTGSHFVGAVVANEGTTAYITNLVVQASGLSNACDSGVDRLRGILFETASGAIWQNTVQGINQGASGCQEGNAIEVRNAPFDGTQPATQTVEIAHNVVENYQKTGIVCNGDVDCYIHHNFVGESETQDNLAANSIQIGFGGAGMVELNHVSGNQWQGTSDYAASAVLLYLNNMSTIRRNNIGGNSDVGLFLVGEEITADNNRVFDGGPDHPNSDYDVGIWNDGTNSVTNNKIRGFDEPTVDVSDAQTVIPSPNMPPEVCFGTDC